MSFIYFLVAFSILVLIHELGHYLAARLFGVKAEEFGFGFPPRLIGFVKDRGRWKRVRNNDHSGYKQTIWSLNWLPLGGFVRIKGEQEDGATDADSIHAKPIWQRIVIISAGVAMNWLLAVVLFTTMFAVGTTAFLDELPAGAQVTNRAVAITDILPGSAADRAGLQVGDRIVSIDGQPAATAQNVHDAIVAHGANTVALVVQRDHDERTMSVTPAPIASLKRPGLGVALSDVGEASLPLPLAFENGVLLTARLTVVIAQTFADIIRQLFVSRTVPEDVSGPVGIAVTAGQIAKQGLSPFLQFAGLLSVNLAVINFLPIPALDGGRALFLIIEKIRRRPISRKLEIGIHNVAFLLLILLIVLVTIHDLSRYGGVIVGGVKGLVGM